MNTELLIVGGIFSAVIAMFIVLVCYVNMEKSPKIIRVLVGLIISCAIGYAMTGALFLEQSSNRKAWNNGYCTICGNEMEFVSASHGKFGTVYYYWYCDECGHILELTSNFGRDN